MKAKVTAIHSGGEYVDGERRIELTFEGGQDVFRKLRIPERMLALAIGVQLDDELDFHCLRIEGLSAKEVIRQTMVRDAAERGLVSSAACTCKISASFAVYRKDCPFHGEEATTYAQKMRSAALPEIEKAARTAAKMRHES